MGITNISGFCSHIIIATQGAFAVFIGNIREIGNWSKNLLNNAVLLIQSESINLCRHWPVGDLSDPAELPFLPGRKKLCIISHPSHNCGKWHYMPVYIYRSSLDQVMACRLTAPSHYLCWLVIIEVLWHSPESNFIVSDHPTFLYN